MYGKAGHRVTATTTDAFFLFTAFCFVFFVVCYHHQHSLALTLSFGSHMPKVPFDNLFCRQELFPHPLPLSYSRLDRRHRSIVTTHCIYKSSFSRLFHISHHKAEFSSEYFRSYCLYDNMNDISSVFTHNVRLGISPACLRAYISHLRFSPTPPSRQ